MSTWDPISRKASKALNEQPTRSRLSLPREFFLVVAILIAVAQRFAACIINSKAMDEFTSEDWSGRRATDLAVVYVALNGDSFGEAVTLHLGSAW